MIRRKADFSYSSRSPAVLQIEIDELVFPHYSCGNAPRGTIDFIVLTVGLHHGEHNAKKARRK